MHGCQVVLRVCLSLMALSALKHLIAPLAPTQLTRGGGPFLCIVGTAIFDDQAECFNLTTAPLVGTSSLHTEGVMP